MRTPPGASAPLPRLGLPLACLLLLALLLPAPAGAAPSVRVVRDVKVPTTGGARISVDVWQPRAAPRPGRSKGPRLRRVALLVHGGGWHSGDKHQWEQSRWTQRLVRRGWLVVNANYRLACAPGTSSLTSERDPRMCGHAMRDSIADVRAALRFTAREARSWGGDPSRIVLFGASAGGQLAMLAASERGRPRGVRAVVAISPPTDLSWVGRQRGTLLYGSARRSIGCDPQRCRSAWRAASPIAAVRARATPPTWIFNAEGDTTTSIVPVRAYVRSLQRHRVPVTLATLADPSVDCHGPIPCAGAPLAGGGGDLFEHAMRWLARRA